MGDEFESGQDRRVVTRREGDLAVCFDAEALESLIRKAVNEAMDDYQHECLLELKEGDIGYVRNIVDAIKEIGDDSLPKGITIVRENHKFVASLHKAATRVGWGVFVLIASVLGTLGIIAAGVWKQSGGS